MATSVDGTKLVATIYGGHIYTLHLSLFTLSPELQIKPLTGNAVVSWLVPSTKFVLQENPDLASTNWTDVTGSPSLNLTNLENEVSVSLSPGRNYYRLRFQ